MWSGYLYTILLFLLNLSKIECQIVGFEFADDPTMKSYKTKDNEVIIINSVLKYYVNNLLLWMLYILTSRRVLLMLFAGQKSIWPVFPHVHIKVKHKLTCDVVDWRRENGTDNSYMMLNDLGIHIITCK